MSLVTKIPSALNTDEYLPIITRTVTQWSRIIAWSWTDYLAFAGTSNEDQERQLKALLIRTLNQQALYAGSFVAYGNPESQARADELSDDIGNLLAGENSAVSLASGISLTLSDIIQEITGERFAPTEYPRFTRRFYYHVLLDTFFGGLEEIPEERRTSGKQYITYIPYPPRPHFSELTVTYEQLRNWASNSVTGDNYLPPSAYIPISGCC